ncbi:MAG: hypothetical protein K2O34_15810, partial [Acetatifactor sp.]|nr:hypothetical protein [Acetatifactor sp.]
TLTATWHIANVDFQNRMKHWIALVAKSAQSESFDVEQFLKDLFAESNSAVWQRFPNIFP